MKNNCGSDYNDTMKLAPESFTFKNSDTFVTGKELKNKQQGSIPW